MLTIERSAWYCLASYDATTYTNTAFAFFAGDMISMYVVSEDNEDIKTELTRLETDKLDIAEYQAWTYVFGATSTGNDDYAITLPYWPEAYVLWQTFRFQADVTNTWEATLNVNALWAITIKKQHNETLEGWDIEAWQIVTVSFDWTNFQMDSQVATIPTIDIHWQDEKTDWDFEDEFIEYDSVSQWNKKIQIWNIPIRKMTNSDYIAGEDIIEWDSLFVEKNFQTIDCVSLNNIWDISANTKISVKQIWSWVSSDKIKILLWKINDIWEDLIVRVETDNAWNPSWTLLKANATATVSRASINQYEANHWFSFLNTGTWATAFEWQRILANKNSIILSVRKWASCWATTAEIRSDANVVLARATFVWTVATFAQWFQMVSWTYYKVWAYSMWSTYTEHRNLNNQAYPVATENITFVSWVYNTTTNLQLQNIAWIDFAFEHEITLSWSVSATKWTPYHIVLSQNNDTVSATSYFKIWYIWKNTETRPMNLFDWTSRWTANKDKFAYCSSDLFVNELLCLSNATYQYKLPIEFPMIATKAYSIWDTVKYDFLWFSKHITWLTNNINYYISDTPWAISSSAWTYVCIIWKWKDTNKLYLFTKPRVVDLPISIIQNPTFSFLNNTGWSIQVKTTGWTVSDIKIRGITVATATNNIANLCDWDTIVVTYSVIPTMVYSDI